MFFWFLLSEKVVAGASGSGFPNSVLDGANYGCAGVAECWVLVFGSSRCASARDNVAFAESVGGIKLASRG